LGIRSQVWMVHNEKDLLSALSAIDRGNFDALVVSASGGIHQQPALSRHIAEVVTRRRLPAITNLAGDTFANAGCLLAYSSQAQGITARLAYFVDRVLRGAKPADLPIEQPTKFDLMINLKTAKALGLTIPQSVLLRAERPDQCEGDRRRCGGQPEGVPPPRDERSEGDEAAEEEGRERRARRAPW